MSNTTETRYLEVSGPEDRAANWLTDHGLVIDSVDGSNGCDFENETAEEYIVKVSPANTAQYNRGGLYAHNRTTLTAYHKGDHEHYLAELRRDLVSHVRHYVEEATGLHSIIVSARLHTQIASLLGELDEIVDNNQSTSKESK
jgi:hypothetical protein